MRTILIIITIIFSHLPAYGQTEEEMDRKGKFFLVPELWLTFGSTTYIDIAPLLGYHITDRFTVGAGPHYIFQSQKVTPFNPSSFETHIYGFKGFSRFALITNAEQYLPINLFSDLFVHMEYEVLSLERRYFDPPAYPDEGRFLYHGLLVGGGISQKVGVFNSISFMVLWDLNESNRSPYSNPVFRIGFNTYL